MAVEWTEPRMVFEISLQAMTHQQHFEKMQVDSFATIGANSFLCFQWYALTSSTVEVKCPNLWQHHYLSKYCPCISSSQPIKRFTHRFHNFPIAVFFPPTFILHWLVEKCRRLNTALQVIKHQEDQIWNWERFGEGRERERETEQQLQLTD